jgi:hypothetical protein
MTSKTSSVRLDRQYLQGNRHIEEAYGEPDQAVEIRKRWRRIARELGIKIRTYDCKNRNGSGHIIVVRETQLPNDDAIDMMRMRDTRERLNRYLGARI